MCDLLLLIQVNQIRCYCPFLFKLFILFLQLVFSIIVLSEDAPDEAELLSLFEQSFLNNNRYLIVFVDFFWGGDSLS